VTILPEHAAFLPTEGAEGSFPLGYFSLKSITGLVAFELNTVQPALRVRFVLNLPVSGIPGERNAAILQTIISNHDGFLRYLLLLLGNDDPDTMLQERRSITDRWLARLAEGEDFPLLEMLTRAACRTPERLNEIASLVGELREGNLEAVIPEDFLGLWAVFEASMEEVYV